MATASVAEELDIIEHIPAGFFPIRIDPASDSLAFEQLEEAFRHGIVVAVAPSAHAAHEIGGLETSCQSWLLNSIPWSEWTTTGPSGWPRHTAINNAFMTNSRPMPGRMDQPTTCRENRSRTTDRHSHPPSVRIDVVQVA